MTRLFLLGSAAALALSACATPLPGEGPTLSQTKRGDFRAVADCSYVRLSDQYPVLAKTGLESAGRVTVAYNVDNVPVWSADFVADDRMTRVDVRARPSVQGGTWNAQKILDQIASC